MDIPTTATLLATIPPPGQGTIHAVRTLLVAQHEQLTSLSGILTNLWTYGVMFLSAFGGLIASWFFTAAAKNIKPPHETDGFWYKMRYDAIQTLAGFFNKAGNRNPTPAPNLPAQGGV